ncbi:MAG: hypothetical protein K8R87_07205 [Verrucomicrobia bacterium]|nr:hypothetical protein [Verrucomicrobiota bacterium]
MNKRTFLTTFSVIGGLKLTAAESGRDLKDHPYLSPENCSLDDPDTRFHNRSDKFSAEFGRSEQAEDQFRVAYAENLEKWIQKKYSETKDTRELIEKAYFDAIRSNLVKLIAQWL